MDGTNKEILRQMLDLLEASERKLAARYDRMILVLDSCLTMGGTASSSSTYAGSNVCGVTGVPAPASSDSDAYLVTIDAEAPTIVDKGFKVALPDSTGFIITVLATCSMEGLTRDSTDSRPAPTPTTAPTMHTDTADIVTVLAAPAATGEALEGQAVSSVTSMPTTCSTDCLLRQPVVAPALVAPSPPTSTEYVLDTESIPVAATLLAITSESPTVLTPMAFTHMVQTQHFYNDSEFFMPTSSQHITSNVPVHRPMPWPSFMDIHANGDEARPLPWPSFREVKDHELLSDAVEKASQWCSSDSSHAKSRVAIDLQIPDFYDNHSSSTGCIIIHDLCNSSEWRCLNGQFLFLEYTGFASYWVHPVHTDHALVWLSCTIGFHLIVMVRSLELKLMSIGPTTEAAVNCAIHDASYWHGYFLTGSRMNLQFTAAIRCLHWLVSYVCDGPTMSFLLPVLWDELVLQPWTFGQQDDSYDQFCCLIQDVSCWPGYFVTGVRMHKQHSEPLHLSGIYLAISNGMFHEFPKWLTYMLQHWNSCRLESAMAETISHDSASEPIPITFQVFTYVSSASTEVHGGYITALANFVKS